MSQSLRVIDTHEYIYLVHWLAESVLTSFNRRHSTHHTFKADHRTEEKEGLSAFLSSTTLLHLSNTTAHKNTWWVNLLAM
jgi:hypothetical protein